MANSSYYKAYETQSVVIIAIRVNTCKHSSYARKLEENSRKQKTINYGID
jgi:hypothetical protein